MDIYFLAKKNRESSIMSVCRITFNAAELFMDSWPTDGHAEAHVSITFDIE